MTVTEEEAPVEVSLDDRGLMATGTRVLVRVDRAKEKSAGGIFLPGASQARPRAGVIVSVGPGRFLENGTLVRPGDPEPFQVGDRVRFSAFSGMDVEKIGATVEELEEDMKVIDESDIYCKERQ